MPNNSEAELSGGDAVSRHSTVQHNNPTLIGTENKPTPGLYAGVFFLVWAIVGWYGLLSNTSVWSTFGAPGLDPGPAVLPVMACSALTLGGLWYVLVGFVQKEAGFDHRFLSTLKIPAFYYASSLVVVFAITLVGFRWAGFSFAIIWLFLLGNRDHSLMRRFTVSFLLGLLIIGVLELVFVQALRVPLP